MPIASSTELGQTALASMSTGLFTVLGVTIPLSIGVYLVYLWLRKGKGAVSGKH